MRRSLYVGCLVLGSIIGVAMLFARHFSLKTIAISSVISAVVIALLGWWVVRRCGPD